MRQAQAPLRSSVQVLFALVALSAQPALADSGQVESCDSPRLEVRATVHPAWKKVTRYSWALRQSVAQTSHRVGPGRPATVMFEIEAARTEGAEEDRKEVSGEICVKNTSCRRTQGLVLGDRVQTIGGYLSKEYVVPTEGEIDPGQTRCFPYRFESPLEPGRTYRNHAKACVDVLGAKSNYRACWKSSVAFKAPTEPKKSLAGRTALLRDVLECPVGFNCSYAPIDQVVAQPLGNYQVTATVALSGPACMPARLVNNAKLSPDDGSPTLATAVSADLVCDPTPNPTPVPGGCARDAGYWRSHAGPAPSPDLVTPLLPVRLGNCGGIGVDVTSASLVRTLLDGAYCAAGAENGIGSLYRELLATSLSMASGTDSSEIRSLLASIGSFLAGHDCDDWESLTEDERLRLQSWQQTLKLFNEGSIGPGACGPN